MNSFRRYLGTDARSPGYDGKDFGSIGRKPEAWSPTAESITAFHKADYMPRRAAELQA